ncbi:glycerate kinase, partial [Bacteroides sp. CAG:633]|uniref:glycerate kinase n=1 Tax=Bacteroides sp. CAG:633 TaxID=1262744 RepID=UPI000A538A32
LDKGLQHLAQVIQQTTGRDIATLPGAGAAGGMGGTLSALLNAELKPGIDLLLDLTDFDKLIEGADLIITGEGKSDRQTVMGKVPSGILKRARRQGIPVILVSGSIEDADILNQAGFRAAFSITPAPMSLEEAMRPSTACQNIMQTVGQICRIWDGASVL